MRPLGQLIRSAALASILGLSLAVPDAIADYVPGRGSRDFWYWSRDTAPIEIFLGGNKREGWTGAQGHTIHLPRAMVYFASGYHQPEYPRLPERIETSHIAVQLVYPDGAPLSAALWESNPRTGMSGDVGSDDFRLRTYSANLFHSEFGVVDEDALSKPWRRPTRKKNYGPVGEIDGLKIYARIIPNGPTRYVVGENTDEFYFAVCRVSRETDLLVLVPGEGQREHPRRRALCRLAGEWRPCLRQRARAGVSPRALPVHGM